MLIRIALIVAILAGAAVGTLNFVKVKEKITKLQADLKEQTEGRQRAETELAAKNKELTKTKTELTQTKTALETTTADLAAAKKDLDKATTELTSTKTQLEKTADELKDTQQQLSAYKATGYNPEQILTFGNQIKKAQEALAASEVENRLLVREVKNLKNELARYQPDPPPVFLPAKLTGKVLVADPKWNFVVLNVGADQGVLKYGELLVNRNGSLVAKVRVTSVQNDQCVANVMPGWQLGEVLEGDQVIPANPSSS
jgi:hypothetical protein